MLVTCPACAAQFDLVVGLEREGDAAEFVALLRELLPGLSAPVLSYLLMHKPPKHKLTLARTFKLLGELVPDIRRGAITRKGRDWPAPTGVWVAAIEHMRSMRDQGKLTLPLSGHGYLYEVMCGMADKAEAAAEAETEQQRRGRTHTGGAAPVAEALQRLTVQPAPLADVPAADPATLAAARDRLARARQAVTASALERGRPSSAAAAPDDQPEEP